MKYAIIFLSLAALSTTPACAEENPPVFVNAQECSLGQGFWKNHTDCWPAQYDPNTQAIQNVLWTDILATPPKGRPWYILARQYIAAMLNTANKAPMSDRQEVKDALTTALNLLEKGDLEAKKLTNRKEYIKLASFLDAFNNEILDEEASSE